MKNTQLVMCILFSMLACEPEPVDTHAIDCEDESKCDCQGQKIRSKILEVGHPCEEIHSLKLPFNAEVMHICSQSTVPIPAYRVVNVLEINKTHSTSIYPQYTRIGTQCAVPKRVEQISIENTTFEAWPHYKDPLLQKFQTPPSW